MARSRVDLPQPLSPTRATASPLATSRSTPRRAWRWQAPQPRAQGEGLVDVVDDHGGRPAPGLQALGRSSQGSRATRTSSAAAPSSRVEARQRGARQAWPPGSGGDVVALVCPGRAAGGERRSPGGRARGSGGSPGRVATGRSRSVSRSSRDRSRPRV